MKAVAEIVTLLIGVTVWYLLKPYIGFGGFLVGAVVAYVSRPIVYTLLGISASAAKSQSRNETEAQQGESTPPSHNEMNQQLALPFAGDTISGESTPPSHNEMNRISMNQHEPRILVRGLYRVDLGHFLGQQEIHITLLERAADGDYERVIVKSISESGTRHILITGVLASAVFSDVHSDVISLPNGDYSFALKDIPSSSQSQVFRDFAELRRSKPDQNHILVCSTYPELASDCGIFDHLPGATDGAAVYVIGYGSRYSNLVANFYRCVNVPGKAKGFVHSIVSLYDSTRIINEDFDELKSIANPVEKLQYFWGMEGLRWETPPMPTLLGITSGDSCAGSHAWLRQGRSFEEKVSQRQAEAAQAGIDLVELHDFEDIAKSNWAPGTVLVYTLVRKPHAIAMVHEAQAKYLPLIQNYVALGACRFCGGFFSMLEYPLVYLGLGANVRFIDEGSNRYAIFESVMNFAEANFQNWVTALEAEKHTMLHLMGPDGRHIVTARVNVDTHAIAGIVDAVNRANAAFETSREVDRSFDKAMTRFFHQHPEPLFWSL